MKFIIHRGAKEIGGTCVEVTAGDTRILLDFGMPLGDGQGGEFDDKALKGKSIPQLIAEKILYSIKGLYKNDSPTVNAILISHAHKDHHGFLKFAHPDIPLFMSKGTQQLIDVMKVFIYDDAGTSGFKVQHVSDRKDFDIGNIRVTPYLVDHSAFDAMAFLIEDKTTGQRIFYTGDFRATGWKAKLFDQLIVNPPKNVDCLLMEGTMIDRHEGKYRTEQDIVGRMTEVLREKDGKVVLAYCSGQNIDRIVAFYKAACNARAILVLDPYTACVLSAIRKTDGSIPQVNLDRVRVFIANYERKKQPGDIYVNKIVRSEYKGLKPYLGRAKIKIWDFEKINKKALILMRNTMIPVIEKIPGIQGSKLVYSQWQGYLDKKDESAEATKAFIQRNNLKLEHIHTSGHATVDKLQELAAAITPRYLIPIHTCIPKKFKSVFDNVLELEDGQPFDLSSC